MKNNKQIKVLIFLITLTISLAIFLLRESITVFSKWGYLGLFLTSFFSSASILLPLPGALIIIASGSAFNPYIVALASAAGEVLGELVGYIAGRSGKHFIIKENKQYKYIQQFMHAYGVLPIFVLAAIPNPFFDIVGVSAGLLHFSLVKFLISVYLGKFIKNAGLASLGGML